MKPFRLTTENTIILLGVLLCAASCATVSAPGLLYQEAARAQIWVSGKPFDIYRSEKERNRYWYGQTHIDPVTKKLWTISEDRNNNILYLYDISSGTVEHEITLQFEERVISNFKVFDNKAVLVYEQRGRYVIIDLITRERKEIQIRELNGLFPFGYSYSPRGFDGKSLIFFDGYYNMEDDSIHFFEKYLEHPRYQSNGNIMIGINREGYIVFYNVYSDKIENTGIRREKFSSTLEYGGIHLYYLDGRYLYASEDIHNFAYIFATLPFVAPRKWYRYDLDTGKRVRINVPSNYIIILGSLENDARQQDEATYR